MKSPLLRSSFAALLLCASIPLEATFDAREDAVRRQEIAALRYLDNLPRLSAEQKAQRDNLRRRETQAWERRAPLQPAEIQELRRLERQPERAPFNEQRYWMLVDRCRPKSSAAAPAAPLSPEESRQLRHLERRPLPTAEEQLQRNVLQQRRAATEAAQPLSDRERQQLRRLQRQPFLVPEDQSLRSQLEQRSEIAEPEKKHRRGRESKPTKPRRNKS